MLKNTLIVIVFIFLSFAKGSSQVCLDVPIFQNDNGFLRFGFWRSLDGGAEEYDTVEQFTGCCPNNIEESPSGGGFLGLHANEGVIGTFENLEIGQEHCIAFYWTNLQTYCTSESEEHCVDLVIGVNEEENIFSCINEWTYVDVCFIANTNNVDISISRNSPTNSGYIFVDNADPCQCELREKLGPNLPNSITIESGELVSMNPLLDIEDYDSFFWEFDNGEIQDADIVFEQEIIESQTVTLVVIKDGCVIKRDIQVIVKDADKVYLGNVFNPNSSINNSFFIQTAALSKIEFGSFHIYDRWGNLVFSKSNPISNNPSDGWYGTINNRQAAQGVYVYSIQYEINGETKNRKGSLTLVR